MASSGASRPGSAQLTRLPLELLQSVLSYLPQRDIKNVRLVCTLLHTTAPWRFDRVFLSVNLRDIRVFNEVADNEKIRQQIVEIVYDDTRLPSAPELDSDDDPDDYEYDAVSSRPPEDPREVPRWFADKYLETVAELERYRGRLVERPRHVEMRKRLEARLSLEESYRVYQSLASEQSEIIASGETANVLEKGLQRFPNLRRITLTPVAHGVPFRPWYETPTLRHLPDGLIYPIPIGWPEQCDLSVKPFAKPWEDEAEKQKWPGFRLIMRVLAQEEHNITEFVVDVNYMITGLSCRIFDEPNTEYDQLVNLLQRPGFSRLDLALFIGGQEYEDWHSFRTTHLQRALAGAKDLRHISLSAKPQDFSASGIAHEDRRLIPLMTVFPVHCWTHLQHFGLCSFSVAQDDLTNLLAALPSTLRSVELSHLDFSDDAGDHCGLLRDMRTKLEWHKRPAAERIKITMYHGTDNEGDRCYQHVDISADANAFVYHGGVNPFEGNEGTKGDVICKGYTSGILRQMFRPGDDIPYLRPQQLMDLGIREKSRLYLQGVRH
jgi:hypothetical protein